jgi:rhodanese-related sulfurtransferase
MNDQPGFELTPKDLFARMNSSEKPLILDVRESVEFANGHIFGCQSFPLQALGQRAPELPKDRSIVTVCKLGVRSGQAALKLRELGFPHVECLAGGMTEWKKAGLPVEEEAGAPWALERQVRFVAGALIALSLGLSYFWFPAIVLAWLVSGGLIIAAMTDTCAMGMLLTKMPWNRRPTAISGA